MNSKTTFYLALIALTIFACGESNKKTGNDVAISDSTLVAECGELVDFTVDNDYCEKFQIPEVEFSTKYGKNLLTDPPELGYQNYHYNYFLNWDDNEIQTEAISLGYSTLQRNVFMKETLANQLLPYIRKGVS